MEPVEMVVDVEEEEEAEGRLTTRDLIIALRARTQGRDVSKVLPDAHWESMFAASLFTLKIDRSDPTMDSKYSGRMKFMSDCVHT